MEDVPAGSSESLPETEPKRRGPKPVIERVKAIESDIEEVKASLTSLADTSVAIMKMLESAQKTTAEGEVPHLPVEPEAVVVKEWGDDGVYSYSSMHRNLTMVQQAGEKVEVNGQIVIRP